MKERFNFTIGEWSFGIFFLLVTIGKSIGLGAGSKILQIITIIAIFFLVLKLIMTKYTNNEIIICAILGAIGLISYLVTKREGVLLSILTIISLKNIPCKRVFKLSFFSRAFMFILLITLSFMGVVEDTQIVHWRDNVGFITRHGLGNGHPNILHTNFFILVILFIYLYYEKLNCISYLFILILNYILYYFSVSRTGFYMVIVTIISAIFIKNNIINRKIFYKLCRIIIPLCVLFTLITAFTYNKFQVIQVLDRFFSGRIGYSNHFLINYSWNLFGRSLSGDKNLLDNGYVMILINYGVVIFGLYIYSYINVINNFIKLKKNKELLMICFFSIYGITEGYLPNVFLNLSLVLLSTLIFNRKNKVVNKRKE